MKNEKNEKETIRATSLGETFMARLNSLNSKIFTLIELLIVIAIIAILAAMLLPALFHAQERMRSAVCLGQVRQLGVAIMMYTDTNNMYYPSTDNTEVYKYPPETGWHGKVFPEVASYKVFICTEKIFKPYPDNAMVFKPCEYDTWVIAGKKLKITYGINNFVTGYFINGAWYSEAAYRPTRLKTPSNTMLLGEGANSAALLSNIADARWFHYGGSNFLAADGHGEYVFSGAFNYVWAQRAIKTGYWRRWRPTASPPYELLSSYFPSGL